MSVRYDQTLSEIQAALIEPEDLGVTWASGFWTPAEVIDSINNRQRDFLKETLCILTTATLVTVPNLLRHPLPQDWIATYDAQWHSPDGTFKELARSDSFEADLGITDWDFETQPKPDYYSDGDQSTLLLQVMPAANDGGVVEIIYVKCSADAATSTFFEVPDEMAPAVKWGVIADMLGKIGRANDPRRAAYAESRYREGIEAAKVMLREFI